MSGEVIKTLQAWMEQGWLYESQDYVFWDMQEYPLDMDIKPVQYPICSGMMRNKDDFPVWAPSHVYGYDSPWGKGVPTVNLEYIRGVLEQEKIIKMTSLAIN